MLVPVCGYRRDEIMEKLLGDLLIHILAELKAPSGSIKIIFETTDI